MVNTNLERRLQNIESLLAAIAGNLGYKAVERADSEGNLQVNNVKILPAFSNILDFNNSSGNGIIIQNKEGIAYIEQLKFFVQFFEELESTADQLSQISAYADSLQQAILAAVPAAGDAGAAFTQLGQALAQPNTDLKAKNESLKQKIEILKDVLP